MFIPFRELYTLDKERWKDYTKCFQCMDVPARTGLLGEGEISKKVFFIEKGAVRAWFNHDGKDITVQFFFENDVVASIESFLKSIPSPTSIETLEKSRIWWAHKKDIDPIVEDIKNDPRLRDIFINGIFERTFDYMKYFVSIIRDTPLQRYIHLINTRPQVVQRLPQHYIASYLGITTVHLSRIKRKLAKEM